MAYLGKQQVSSGFVQKNGQKKSLFAPPKFPEPTKNVTAPSATTEGAEYRQPQPGEMIANVMRSMGMEQLIYPLPSEEGVQLQETKQTETQAEQPQAKPLLAPPCRDDPLATAPRTDDKHLLALKRDDGQYRPPENQLLAPSRPRSHMDGVVQTKLTIGRPNDKYEQEADRVAAAVVQQINRPAPVSQAQGEVVQSKEKEEEEELNMKPMVQRRDAIGGGEASTELERAINRARGGGQSLDAGLQQSMGQAMGADFSGVMIHTNAQADQLNQSLQAKAFTSGQDVFFRQGAYQPRSHGGQELIAHELTHVVQQNGGAVQRSPHRENPSPKIPSPLAEDKVVYSTIPTDLYLQRRFDTSRHKVAGWLGGNGRLQIQAKNNCGCASCSLSEGEKKPEIQRAKRKRADSDPDYDPNAASSPPCVDTKYHEDDCSLKSPYDKQVRKYFYPSNYHANVKQWKDSELLRLQDSTNTNNFICPECKKSKPPTEATIEHIFPVVKHWNMNGYDQMQNARITWYNDTTNHKIMCQSCNSRLGGKGANYQDDVGPNFVGP